MLMKQTVLILLMASAALTGAVADDDASQPCKVYTLQGMPCGSDLRNLAPGIYIVRQGQAAHKVRVE